jgi:hypothetical protein
LTGEEDEFLEDAEFFFGVLTSSVLMVSAPLRLIECTSFSSRTWPFGTIFFGFDDVDMVGMSQTKKRKSGDFRINHVTVTPFISENI